MLFATAKSYIRYLFTITYYFQKIPLHWEKWRGKKISSEQVRGIFLARSTEKDITGFFEKSSCDKGFLSKGQKVTNGWKPVRESKKIQSSMRWSDFWFWFTMRYFFNLNFVWATVCILPSERSQGRIFYGISIGVQTIRTKIPAYCNTEAKDITGNAAVYAAW